VTPPPWRLPYHRVDGNDYWVGDERDPRTYGRPGPAGVKIRSPGSALAASVIVMFAPGLQLPSLVAPACVRPLLSGADTRI
jgi:hypothetical protein